MSVSGANVGDSGWWVLRKTPSGKLGIAHCSTPRHHAYNCPHQLGKLDGVELNTPADAELSANIELQLGDTVMLATDGLFDSLHTLEILELIAGGLRDDASAASLANALVHTAVELSKDAMRLSPVVLAMQREGLVARSREAQDDVTVVLARVSEARARASR
jgi:serine/threonine protein phosphatase PrpC